MNSRRLSPIVVVFIAAVLGINLPVAATADKDCSVGKAIIESYENRRDGNDTGTDFSSITRNVPGIIGDVIAGFNIDCDN